MDDIDWEGISKWEVELMNAMDNKDYDAYDFVEMAELFTAIRRGEHQNDISL